MNNDFDSALFQPEVVLPAQMSWGASCDGNTSGARALMLAILEDAMLCIERGSRRRHWRARRLATDAESWVRSDSREWLFSFVSICDVLGIDADAVRVRLLTNVGHPATAYAQRARRPTSRQPQAAPWSVCCQSARAHEEQSGSTAFGRRHGTPSAVGEPKPISLYARVKRLRRRFQPPHSNVRLSLGGCS
jgi:hypothetical protein